MARRTATFLMFQNGDAETAMRFYVSLFEGARINRLERWVAGEPGAEGTIKLAEFELTGHRLLCSDSPVRHAFGFTPALSLFIDCDGADELDRVFAQLADGGQVLMPVDNYGFSQRFGWCNDRYGVSWQLNLN